MTKKNFENAVVKATLNWVCFNIPNKKSDKFQADCCNLSPEDIKKLQNIGLGERVRVKEDKEEYGNFITVKSNIKAEQWRDNDEDLRWFNVTDAQRMPVDLNKIGNGSEALVKIEAVPYDNDFGKGVKADIKLVVITKLIEYVGGENHDDMYEVAGNLPELEGIYEGILDVPEKFGEGDGWGDDDAEV